MARGATSTGRCRFMGGACFGTPNIGAIGFSGCCVLHAAHRAARPPATRRLPHRGRLRERMPTATRTPNGSVPTSLVVWGNEPLRSNADGYLGHWLNVCVQMGTKVISIDPQLTWWGARAAYWLPLCPATDLALALAWLNVITAEDLIDHEFVDCWCAYYDELKEHVAAVHARLGRRDLPGAGGGHSRSRALLRGRRARRHPVGPRLRHAGRLHPAVPDGVRTS